ncbi:MAG: response regulator, partial [bacterium]
MKKKIIVIDDEKSITNLIKKFLNYEYFQVDTIDSFSTLEEVVEKIKGLQYDCVLLDYILICGNGLELCERLRK